VREESDLVNVKMDELDLDYVANVEEFQACLSY